MLIYVTAAGVEQMFFEAGIPLLQGSTTAALKRPHVDEPFLDLIESSPARGKEREIAPHPSLKPQAFVREIVRAVLPFKRGVILDPFMGAGSTIAAAAHPTAESGTICRIWKLFSEFRADCFQITTSSGCRERRGRGK